MVENNLKETPGVPSQRLVPRDSLVQSMRVQTPGPFSPDSLGGLSLWLDADDDTTLNAGSPTHNAALTQWEDKSPSGLVFTRPSAPRQPVYNTGLLNGRAGVVFTEDFMTEVVASPYNNEQGDLFAVLRPTTDDSTFDAPFSQSNTSETDRYFALGTSDSSAGNIGLIRLADGTVSDIGWSQNYNVNEATLINVGSNGSQYFTQLNGSGTTADRSFTNDGAWFNGSAGEVHNEVTLGRIEKPGVVQHWNGHMFEFILYNRRLTNAERKTVTDYLGAKWNISTSGSP